MLSEFGIMKGGWSRWTALAVAAGLAAACVDETVAPTPETGPPPAPAKPRVIGFAELTFSGIGTPDLAPSLLIAPTLEELEALRAQRERSGDLRDVVSQDLTFPRNSDGNTGDGTIQLQLDEPDSFPFDSVRYVSATFDVRNAQSDGTAYDIPHTNITFLPVSTNGTINQTAVRKLEVGDGSPDARALQVLPTDRLEVVGDTLRASHPDVLQILRETEVAAVLDALPASAGVTSVFPYGFVVRRAGDNTTRELPAPSDNTFPGRVDFSFSIPDDAGLQTLSVLMVAVVDSETRLTQGPQEQTAAAQDSLEQLAATLVGTDTVTLLPGGSLAPPAGVGLRTLCSVRTAGIAGTATAHLVNIDWAFQSFSPSPGSIIDATQAFQATFSAAVQGAGPENFTVRGLQSGPAFLGQNYTVNGPVITTPMASFFAGEEVEIALTNVLSCPQPQVARFHVQADSATGSFDADSSYTDFAPAPSAVAIGDLDGVNGLDAAVVSGSNIVILLNNSNGKFTVQSQTYAVNSPSAIAIGDLDGINGLDLAVASESSDNVFVLLNTGNGTFQAPVPHDAGGGTADIAIGDLNGDGSLDLATAGNGPNFIVLMNNGAGTFPTHQMGTLAGGTIGRAVAIGDLNGNGSPDIAVGSRNPNEVTVILNDGHGKFTPQSPTYPVGDFAGAWPNSMAIGDLGGNGGGLDIAVATSTNNGVSVLLNNDDGTGTFQSPALYLARIAVSLAIGDVNGDGRLDIAAAIRDPNNGNGGEVLLNNGSGTFSPNPSFFVGTVANAIAMGDLNGNGILDLAFTTNGDPISQSDLSVWLGQAPVP